MHLTSYLQDGRLTIALKGEIDHHCAKDYIQAITGKIEAYTPKECVLDFREVAFMDSSGIAMIINTLRNMNRLHGQLSLCSIGKQPMKVLQASGIEKLVYIKEVSDEI